MGYFLGFISSMYHSENPFLCNIKQVKSNTTQKKERKGITAKFQNPQNQASR
jgi:hypothetical protein